MTDRERTAEDDLESRLRDARRRSPFEPWARETMTEAADRLKLYRDRICELEGEVERLRNHTWYFYRNRLDELEALMAKLEVPLAADTTQDAEDEPSVDEGAYDSANLRVMR